MRRLWAMLALIILRTCAETEIQLHTDVPTYELSNRNLTQSLAKLRSRDVEIYFLLPSVSERMDLTLFDRVTQLLATQTQSLKVGKSTYGGSLSQTVSEGFCFDFPITDYRKLNGSDFNNGVKTCGTHEQSSYSLDMMAYGMIAAGYTPVASKNDAVTRMVVLFTNHEYVAGRLSELTSLDMLQLELLLLSLISEHREETTLRSLAEVLHYLGNVVPVIFTLEDFVSSYKRQMEYIRDWNGPNMSYIVDTYDSLGDPHLLEPLHTAIVTGLTQAVPAALPLAYQDLLDAELYFLLPGTEEGRKSIASDPRQLDWLIQDLLPQFQSLKVGRGLYGNRPCHDLQNCFCHDFALTDVEALDGEDFIYGMKHCSGNTTATQLEAVAYAAETAAGFTYPEENDRRVRFIVLITDTLSNSPVSGPISNYKLGWDLQCKVNGVPPAPLDQVAHVLRTHHVHLVIHYTGEGTAPYWWDVLTTGMKLRPEETYVSYFPPDHMEVIRSTAAQGLRRKSVELMTARLDATLAPTTTGPNQHLSWTTTIKSNPTQVIVTTKDAKTDDANGAIEETTGAQISVKNTIAETSLGMEDSLNIGAVAEKINSDFNTTESEIFTSPEEPPDLWLTEYQEEGTSHIAIVSGAAVSLAALSSLVVFRTWQRRITRGNQVVQVETRRGDVYQDFVEL
eukprot:Blabericola_migrator_1__9547@NODE_519_length_7920_cov_50_641666_g397_i0_p2_GENE_NODE_519_length_7920_cov_50_641666_g397_i0NODE_519_length_7920_cov_50_641666_g397_i0_p2_ORF_typecomplete_len677_score109_62_NODE_519_length_7920_cov_50_641666_g397_i028934923